MEENKIIFQEKFKIFILLKNLYWERVVKLNIYLPAIESFSKLNISREL